MNEGLRPGNGTDPMQTVSFSYAGIGFEVLGSLEVGPRLRRAVADGPAPGRVVCALTVPRPSDELLISPPIDFAWDKELCLVKSGPHSGQLRELAEGQFVANVRAPSLAVASEMIAAPVIERMGGLLVHCAGVVDPQGEAHLFLGPSGAGKSTAARNTKWATFVVDRAALLPTGDGGWVAWRCLGGEPNDWPNLAGPVMAPVKGLYRVRQGTEPALRRLVEEASFALRESVIAPSRSPLGELELLDRLAQFGREVKVGEVVTTLDTTTRVWD